MDYSAVGLTTHLAERVEQAAAPGSILITSSTFRLAEVTIEVRPGARLNVRDAGHPVDVFELVGTGPARSRLEMASGPGLTRFVGRDAQLQRLRESLARAGRGHGQVVALVGEAGVGKSRLVGELLRSHVPAGWRTLRSRSVSYGKSSAYLSAIDLVRDYFGVDERDDTARIAARVQSRIQALDPALASGQTALLSLLGVSIDDPRWDLLDPRDRRGRTRDALKALLIRESIAQPLLVVVEDLHWIDEGTQECLDSLVEGLPRARAVLLVSYRPEYQHGWGGKTHYTQVRVDPLPPGGAATLLGSILGADPGLAPVMSLLIERSDGNPLFLEEMARTLVETGTLVGERGAYRLARPLVSLEAPPSVQAVLAARIDRLPPEDKWLLQAASAVGKDVRLAVLRDVAGLAEPELRGALGRLQAAELLLETRLFPEVEYTFKHALTHEVAYGGLVSERRRELHARTLAALERLHAGRLAEVAEALAHHAVRAEAWAPAVDHLRAAAARAYERGALSETLEHLDLALELAGRLAPDPDNVRRTLDVRLDLHAPVIMMGAMARLIELHDGTEAMARAAGDDVRLARALYRVSSARWVAGRYGDGLATAGEALALGRHDPETRIFATLYLGIHSLFAGHFHAAVEHFERIIDGPDAALAHRRFGASTPAYVVSNNFLLWALVSIGEFDRALAHGRRSLEACEASGAPTYQVTTYAFFAIALAYRGEFEAAVRYAEDAVRVAEASMIFSWLPGTYSALGWILAWTGRAEAALVYLERSVSVHESLGINTYLSVFCCRWAEALRLAGRALEAEGLAARALELARRFGERGIEAEALLASGEIAEDLAPGDLDLPDRLYKQAEDLARELGMRPVVARAQLHRGLLRRRAGDEEGACARIGIATGMFREMDMRFWLGRAEDRPASSARPGGETR
jgi:predicted ATPase